MDNFTKRTNRCLSPTALKLRKAIENAKDPEKTFFEDFPIALDFTLTSLQNSEYVLEDFVNTLQDNIHQIRTCLDDLLKRFEKVIAEKTGFDTFPDYQEALKKRFKKVRKHALLTHQEAFYHRIYSQLDERKAWLSSIAHACLNKHIDNFSDDDEFRLYDRFNALVEELDDLSDITTQKDFDTENENVFQISLTSFVEGLRKRLIRLPKTRTQEMITLEEAIKKVLNEKEDKSLKIAILADLLQEELRNE